jgi:hypothetical protein
MTPMTRFFSTYCERSATGLWEEPLNALTNLAFIIAALLAWRLYYKQTALTLKSSGDIALLIALLFAIGLGSALWHFIPTEKTVLADVIPILLFINVYLLSFLFRVVRCRLWVGIAWFLLFHAMNFAISNTFEPDFLNGSVFYAPAWLALLMMGGYLYYTKHELKGHFIGAGALFTLSLVFRSIDHAVCGTLPFGTHFMWHVLNAWLLYLLTSVLIQHSAGRSVKS